MWLRWLELTADDGAVAVLVPPDRRPSVLRRSFGIQNSAVRCYLSTDRCRPMPTRIVYSKNLNSSPKASGAARGAKRTTGAKIPAAEAKGAARKLKRGQTGTAKLKQAGPNPKIVVDTEGRRHALQTLDAHSRNFGHDFGEAFKKSVKRARRDNTRIIGRPDIAVAK